MSASMLKPTFLIILDGWGLAPAGEGNAASLAWTPALNAVIGQRNLCRLHCSGRDVGLPTGFMGNSEVGHMNIGAGRVVYQDMTRIDIAVEENSLGDNPAIRGLMEAVRARGGKLHLAGLLSDGGVHSHIRHLSALLELAEKNGLTSRVHAFMDGRDSSPVSGAGFVRVLREELRHLPHAALASLIGRYYAMDRDQRWERTQVAWEALTQGKGSRVSDAVSALEEAYATGESDEFLKPRLVCAGRDEPEYIRNNDGIFFFNFRADRARQLVRSFHALEFDFFKRGGRPNLAGIASMTPYDHALPLPAAFEHENIPLVMGEVLSKLGCTQLRIAETEKYAHVTYFFNGGREEPFPGETRRLIPSPRDVATYDLKPEMSAVEVTDTLIREWNAHRYDFVVCNFANPDMVGHTGVIPAAIAALETVDACLERILAFGRDNGCRLVVTADHGNVEEMLTPERTPQTAHSKNPVPFVILDEPLLRLRTEGRLADIVPTILDLWGVEKPAAMTGESLVGK